MSVPYRLKTDGWWLSDRIDWVGPTLPVCPPAEPVISLARPLPRDKTGGIARLGRKSQSDTSGKRTGACQLKS